MAIKKKDIKVEIPIEEPTVEEQIKMETDSLEKKVQDLTIALYNKEHEVEALKAQLVKDRQNYNNAIARLILSIYGG